MVRKKNRGKPKIYYVEKSILRRMDEKEIIIIVEKK